MKYLNILFLMTIIYFVSFSCINLYSQESKNQVTEIELGATDIIVPLNLAFTTLFPGSGWDVEVISDTNELSDNISNDFVKLSSIEDTEDTTSFLFFRTGSGISVLKFSKEDKGKNVLYVYTISFEWIEKINIPDDFVLFSDEYIKVVLLTSDDYEARFASLPSLSDETKESLEAVIDISPVKNMNVANIDIGKDQDDIDEDDMMNNGDDMMKEDTSDLEVLALEKDENFSSLSFDEMNNYINKNWNMLNYDDMMKDIDTWIHAHEDKDIASATLLWNYGQIIHANLKSSNDVRQVISINRRIYQEYPLSDQYFDAKKLVEKLKEKFVFVLK